MSEKSQLFSRIAMDWSDPEQVLKVIENRKLRARPELEADFVEPSTPIHKQLAEIWTQVLGIERVGIHDNFFKLGGHSLLATQVVARIRDHFRVDLTLRNLFETPTVAGLAARVEPMLANEQSLVLPAIARVERAGPLPLSFAQQRMWFLDQFEPERAVYNVAQCFQLSGRLEVALLERALNEVVSRHESLRTTFVNGPDGPEQVITAAQPSNIPVEDLEGLCAAERADEVTRLTAREVQAPFDLSVGPLLRVRLVRLSRAEHLLLLTLHHIICDGWSIGVLIQELVRLYQSYSTGEAAALVELPIQYADYAAWQREWLHGPELEQQLSYWKQQLAGAPAVLSLPADRPRPALQTFQGGRVRQNLPAELREQLQQLSQRHGVTLFMTLLAAFQLLLGRYSGQAEVVVGTPIANRARRELEGLIGFFANTLVLRTELSGDPSFAELLERVREVCLGAYQHQDLPFEKLVEELQPERSLSHAPLFQVMFILQNNQGIGFEEQLPQLQVKAQEVETRTAKFDLTLAVNESEAGLHCSLEYNTDLFDEETAARLLRHWSNVLQAVSADTGQRLSEVQLLSEAERQQLLREWNQTAVATTAYGRAQRVDELIAAQSELRAAATAVRCGEERLSYDELNGRANQLARYLQERGVGPEMVVGICMERSLEMLVGLLGVLKAGAAYLPLDPDYPGLRLEFMLADSQAPVLLTQERLQGRLRVPQQTRVVAVDADWEEIAAESAAAVSTASAAGDLAYVIYTSGSTGVPKGVMISHGNVLNFVTGMDAVLGQAGGVWLAVTSISFDISVLELLWTLARGYEVVLHVGDKDSAIAELIARHQVTHLQCTPSLATMLAADSEGLRRLSSLETLLLGGEALPLSLAQQLSASAPGSILNMYGPTETTIWSSTYRLRGGERTIPIGSPIANTQLYVLDQHLAPVPLNVAGELYIGGKGVGRGYQQRPELTATRFVPDPFSTQAGARLYRTGDMARYRGDGLVEYLGRADHQLKLRGYRIELGEIEAVLGAHAAVQECVVVAQGAGDEVRLVAYVVLHAGQTATESELRQHAGERLPQYMVPAVFMVLDKMPLTPNGKVNRGALPEVEASQAALGSAYEAARTATEATLVSLWREVLKVERVGIQDNFFALGGHSLLATQVVARIRDLFRVELPLRYVFAYPTVNALAAKIDATDVKALIAQAAGTNGSKQRLTRRRVAGNAAPLTFAQQRLWFLAQLQPSSTAYNINFAVRVSGPLDHEALERSLNELVRRHEGLRTSFAASDGKPRQVIAPELHLRLRVVDNTTITEADQAAEIERRVLEQSQAPFDLSEAPLLRMSLLRFAEEDHVVVFTIHHIISDGWSLNLLTMEMAKLYEAFRQGKSSPLPPLPLQYADFAVWQREVLQEELLEAELNYWREQLADASFVLDLPTDRPRLALQNSRGATQTFLLDGSLTKALIHLSQRENVTLFMTLLAAFQILLYRYTGQADILVGTPIAGRNQIETEKLIGFFANTLVLRTRISSDLTFRELLGHVREMALGAYSHQDLPFEKLVEALQPERDLGRNPIFQVLFALNNTPAQPVQLTGLVWTPLNLNIPKARFDLAFDLRQLANGIAGTCEYNADLFDAETITRLLSHYRTLLESVLNPEQRVSHLPLLTDSERQKMLLEWNSPPAEYSNNRCLHELFERQAELNPSAVAVVYENVRLTYADLNRRANQLAHYLRAHGVGPDVPVGISIERGVEMMIGLLGILKAGGAYVPLDPAYPKERLDFMLRDAGVSLLLTMKRLRRLLPEDDEIKSICLDEDWTDVGQESEKNVQVQMSSRNLAYVIYTSGSTGRPKGVQVEHESVVSLFAATQPLFDFSVNDIWTVSHSYAFDFSVWEIWGCLLHGGRLVIVPLHVNQSPEAFRELLRAEQVTILSQTPSAIRQLLQGNAKAAEDLALRLIVCGGEALPREVEAQLADWGVPAWNFYGPTEATVWAAINKIETVDNGNGPVAIGRPLANTQVYVLDSNLELLPVNVPGELYIGGAGVARGYYQRSELTAERFVPDAYSGAVGGRLYRTGDRVRYGTTGKLEFLGRGDEQVKLRGYRVELGEIESVLGEAGGVQQAIVVVRGENSVNQRLMAYVVLENGAAAASEAEVVERLRGHLSRKLPEHMMPSAFVVLPELPLTSNGKLNRRALPIPGATTRTEPEDTYVAPRTPTEAGLTSIWSEVLKIDRIGIDDNFFKLGGHSLLATQVVTRIRDLLRVELPLRYLFEYPTVNALAAKIEAANGKALIAPPIMPVLNGGAIPLSFAQQRLWFMEQLESNTSLYNLTVAYLLKGELKVAALEFSLNEVLRRQASLRTYFVTAADGSPAQRIMPPAPFPLRQRDLRHLPEPERELEARRVIEAEGQQPFQLSRAPLFRCLLLRTGEEEHIFILTIHHIITDGWSMNVFQSELAMSYQAYLEQRPASLPELSVQYTDFAVWQRNWLRGEVYERLLEYWQQQLKGAPVRLELPADKPRPATQSYHGGSQFASLSAELTQSLRELSRREEATLYMTLLACLNTLLHYYTGESDIVVGSEVANRNRGETESLIGFFVNELVMRTDLTGNPTFRELLRRVREVTLGAYGHQDMPFDRLVDALKIERSPAYHPLFQVSFVYQNAPRTTVDVKSLRISTLPLEYTVVHFDLVMRAWESGPGMQLRLEYNSDLFLPTTISRLVDLLETIIGIVVQEPETRLETLVEMLAQADRARLSDKGKAFEEIGLKSLKNARRRAVTAPS